MFLRSNGENVAFAVDVFRVFVVFLCFSNLADVAVTVANPHVLQPLAIEPDGGRRAGELKTSASLPDRDQ